MKHPEEVKSNSPRACRPEGADSLKPFQGYRADRLRITKEL